MSARASEPSARPRRRLGSREYAERFGWPRFDKAWAAAWLCCEVLAGCSPPAGDGAATSAAPTRVEPSSGPSSSGTETLEVLEDSPFSPYLPAITAIAKLPDYTEAQEAEIRERVAAQSEFIAECMRDRGFDYFGGEDWEPDDTSQETWFVAGEEDVIPVGRMPEGIERVRAEGYGLWGPAGGAQLVEGSESDRANEEYRASLSAEAAAAYDLALGGQDYLEQPDLAIPAGCGALAIEAHPEADSGEISVRRQFWIEFGPLILGMNRLVLEDVFQDQRVRDLSLDWYDCMAKAGYGVLVEGWQYTTDNITLNAGADLAKATHPDGQVGEFWYRGLEMAQTPDSERSLVASSAEIAIAVADFECREPLDYFDTHKAVQLELEQRYVEENQAAFDGLLDFYERYRSGDLDP
ncbi:MAG: hypothetical protein LBG60_17440 [Bifidobacteriaceae bacterium]|nr:hypothetical protein [Bifidobacteriaceae bacterium]